MSEKTSAFLYKIISYLVIATSLPFYTGCTAIDTAVAKAAYAMNPPPMDRKLRSYFQPYVSENGESRFLTRNMFFDGEDPKVNNGYYSKWLQEWFKQYDYCKNGYEIISNTTERFAGSEVNANLGGHLVTHGRCKTANP